MTDLIKWDFAAETAADYRLVFNMTADSKLFKQIYSKSRTKLLRKGVNAGSPDTIEKFDIPKQYLNLITTAIKKHIKQVAKEVKEDKIEVLSGRTESAYFKRNNAGDWDINIQVVGQYANKN